MTNPNNLYEVKTKALNDPTRWEDTEVMFTLYHTPEDIEWYALHLSEELNRQVRYNERTSAQGHYTTHPSVIDAYFLSRKVNQA